MDHLPDPRAANRIDDALGPLLVAIGRIEEAAADTDNIPLRIAFSEFRRDLMTARRRLAYLLALSRQAAAGEDPAPPDVPSPARRLFHEVQRRVDEVRLADRKPGWIRRVVGECAPASGGWTPDDWHEWQTLVAPGPSEGRGGPGAAA